MAMVRNGKTVLDGIGEGNSAKEVNAAAAEDGATIIMTCSQGQGAHTYTHVRTHTFIYISRLSHYAAYIISFDFHN